jgi:MFS family permease
MALPVARTADGSVEFRTDLSSARIPEHALAVMAALRFDGDSSRLAALDEAGHGRVLEFCDRAQLTLLLNSLCRDALPGWVRQRIDRNLADYSQRFDRLKRSLFEIAEVLDQRGIEFVLVKGLAHSPDFTPEALLRAQGDIDLWTKPHEAAAAAASLGEIGYVPVCESEGRHLPPLSRETQWEWRGDFFAPDLPISVDVHYELWDERAERIPAPDESDFWERRITAWVDGHPIQVLSPPDALAFAALHLLMHLLHGDLRLQRAWEIARFLNTHAGDSAFWATWRQCHSDSLRRLEAVVFRLVAGWFAAALSTTAEEEIEALPEDVQLWIERYGLSPIEALFHPNKDEIWLHVSLAQGLRDKCSIFLRRVLPLRVPALASTQAPTASKVRLNLLYAGRRALHHARTLAPAVAGAVRWQWARTRIGGVFLEYQIAAALFCIGVVIFLLLYNLYLLRLGFHEDVLGHLASAMSVGTLSGALPAAWIARRFGLRNMMLMAILGGAAAACLRVLAVTEPWLLATAFLNGLCLSLWAVSYQPAIAGATDERNRHFAFSLSSVIGMLECVVGGLLGGWLPGLLRRFAHSLTAVGAERAALLVASGIISLAAFPAARLRFAPLPKEESKTYPRGRFILVFLFCLCWWSAAVTAFHPFFNAFFAQRMRMQVARIGLVYSGAQFVQAMVVMAAPLVLRRLGQVKGTAWMQFGTACALAALAFSPNGGMAAIWYAGFLSLQYMCDPGLFSMLMERVRPGERSGASALYFLVTSLMGSLSALAAGSAITRFGYPSVLITSAGLATVAAVLFRTLIPKKDCSMASITSC